VHALREARLMRWLGKHPNIITLRDLMVNLEDDELYIGARAGKRGAPLGASAQVHGLCAPPSINFLPPRAPRAVMELLDSDLHRIIQSPQPLEDAHFKHFMFQLLRGLRFAHSYGIVHRDLKPANLLVTKACDLVISDFGLARQMPEGDGPMTEVRSRKPRRQWP